MLNGNWTLEYRFMAVELPQKGVDSTSMQHDGCKDQVLVTESELDVDWLVACMKIAIVVLPRRHML